MAQRRTPPSALDRGMGVHTLHHMKTFTIEQANRRFARARIVQTSWTYGQWQAMVKSSTCWPRPLRPIASRSIACSGHSGGGSNIDASCATHDLGVG